jgi:hypothetical protein
MVTILEALQTANDEAGIRTLSFANLQEFQAFQDSFRFEEWPVNVVVPITINGTIDQNIGTDKDIYPIQGWILTRIKSEPELYRSKKMEIEYIAPLRILAKKFIKNLAASEIVDPEVTTVPYSIRAEYMFLNNLAFGVAYTASIPLSQNVC